MGSSKLVISVTGASWCVIVLLVWGRKWYVPGFIIYLEARTEQRATNPETWQDGERLRGQKSGSEHLTKMKLMRLHHHIINL